MYGAKKLIFHHRRIGDTIIIESSLSYLSYIRDIHPLAFFGRTNAQTLRRGKLCCAQKMLALGMSGTACAEAQSRKRRDSQKFMADLWLNCGTIVGEVGELMIGL